jgi:WD40 repeat protein
VYDLKNLSIRHKLAPSDVGGYSKLMFSTFKLSVSDNKEEKAIMLYAASTVGDFFVIDPRSGSTVKTLKGHISSINWFVEVSQLVITAGDDNLCLVFDPNN